MRMPLALVLACTAAPLAAAPDAPPAARCTALIALFDEVIVSRFDHRILMLEDHELDQARELRRQAEENCAAGREAIGVDEIESALHEIGIVPPPP